MDKRILTREELLHLQQFIISRSQRFAEPAILLEITDHFACKTEEVLQAEPALSLASAMKKAHEAFGVRGFAPIAEAYEQQAGLRYRQYYRQSRYKVLFSLHGPGLVLLGILVAQAYTLLEGFIRLPDQGFWLVLLLEGLYAAGLLAIWHRRRGHRHQIVNGLAYGAANQVFSWLWLGICIIPVRETFPGLAPVFAGILAALLALQLLTLLRLRKKVNADIEDIERRLQLQHH